tara:strand:- start:316 stop:810 length:495 start_codon:yes stop_codon:yes gene_type:complete
MNIFILDNDMVKSASYLFDSHITKMPTEMGQMLACCYTKEDLKDAPLTKTGNVRGHSHYNHPCSKWVRESTGNFLWGLNYAFAMCSEKEYRYPNNGEHGIRIFLDWCSEHVATLPESDGVTPHVKCMPDHCKSNGVVESYRTLYTKEKAHLAKWTRRWPPEWWN